VTQALDRMLARNGKSLADYAGRKNNATKLGRMFRRKGVAPSKDLDRIASLPRRRWQDDPDLEEMRRELTDWLRAPGGTMELRLVQAASLMDLHDFGGLFGPQRVGAGKTILSFLAGTVLGAERPLLIIPAKLKRKTEREFRALAKQWLGHPRLEVMSYELLSRDRGYSELERINPDLLILDEAHRAKNKAAGCTRKIARWMKDHPETRFCAMSGTIANRSLREYAHILRWCLKEDPPLPMEERSLSDWADALDEKVDPKHRMAPGALLELCTDEEVQRGHNEGKHGLTHAARLGFRRRLTETPGVVATEEGHLGTSLSVQALLVRQPDDVGAMFHRMREEYETPDGHPFSEPVDLWRHARELACDFFYRWDPPAPDAWMEARKGWSRFVRDVLGNHRKGIDTEFQVAKACKAGDLDSKAYDVWCALRGTFKPNSVPVWVGDAMLKAASEWLAEENPGLCWVEHVAFAQKLSFLSGVPYFGEQGEDHLGRMIEEHDGPAILSIAANSEGRNLQRWCRNLIVSCPPNGRLLEQLMGRTHREGQEADEVSVEIAMACVEQWDAFEQARADARYVEATTGQAQKLCYADVDVPTPDDVKNFGAKDLAWRS